MALKANMYQAEGNLQESAKLLIDVNERTTSPIAFEKKLNQLRLERKHAEAIRLLQARLAQDPSAFEEETATFSPAAAVKILYLYHLAFAQRFVGDMAGAKVTAEQVRNTAGASLQEGPDNPASEIQLALADALLGERDSALREAELLFPSANASPYEEVLALIQTVVGENSRAISTLTRLLKTPYGSFIYGAVPVTPALLRLDPLWDPLRGDSAFQKLCEEKQPPATP
jgi:hypothetical protein